MKPSIGRIVLYQRHGSPNGQHKAEPSPAIITKVYEGTGAEFGMVDLCVINPTGIYFDRETMYDPQEAPSEWAPGRWRWPPRIEQPRQETSRDPSAKALQQFIDLAETWARIGAQNPTYRECNKQLMDLVRQELDR